MQRLPPRRSPSSSKMSATRKGRSRLWRDGVTNTGPWLKYFEEVSRSVPSEQNEAIANFTHDYGPCTSVIQRRLRSVYGFNEIEIQAANPRFRVKRHGKELRPTDYLSQSQQQTLFLVLFLTTCISQTWSAFSPIFLDDPVAHFDDPNTYAFLDLIVGPLEARGSRMIRRLHYDDGYRFPGRDFFDAFH